MAWMIRPKVRFGEGFLMRVAAERIALARQWSKVRSSAAFPKCTSMASTAFRGIQGQLFGTMLAFIYGLF